MSCHHFSKNSLLEEAATRLAEKLFGQKWETTVHWEPTLNEISIRDWTMAWNVEQPSNKFCLNTVKEGQNESLDINTPARLEFDSDGRLMLREFCHKGLSQDPKPGAAAIEEYYPNQMVKARYFFDRGRLNDPADDQPAKILYYDNGSTKEVWREKDGNITDTAYGEPAVIFYSSDGRVSRGISSVVSSKGTGRLDSDEAEKRLAAGRKRRIVALCGSETINVVGKSNMAPVVDISNGRGK